jgi:hypothetical protein
MWLLGRPTPAADAVTARSGSAFGAPSGRTIPQVNGEAAPRAAMVRAVAARGPLFATRIPSSAMRMATEPSLSVR